MAGRITRSEEQLRPDPRFQDMILSKFINCVMRDGKKAVATRVVYSALDEIQRRLDKDGGIPSGDSTITSSIDLFHKALSNVKPEVEVRSKRVGGANYQVPMPLKRGRQQSLTFRWIIDAARAERGKPMHLRLAKELNDAARGEGKAVETKNNTHRMADANKAFAHFAW